MTTSEGQALADKIADIFVQPVIIRTESVANTDLEDLPAELVLHTARDKRQREFAAGRLAAWQAIKENGHKPEFPAIGEGRQPVWPAEITGSISHTSAIAMAAVAAKSVFHSIGIDIEEVQPLDESVIASVLTAREIEQRDAGENHALRLFSFKESIFKCVFPVYGEFIDFKEVEISPGPSGLRAACVDKGHAASGLIGKIRGDSCCVDNHVVSACWLPASSSSTS